MNDELFRIILSLIPVLGLIVTYFIVPLIKEKVGINQLEQYKIWTKLAVKTAEMLWVESGHGMDKKSYVVKFLNDMFNSKKQVLTEEQINILIEAAVQELKRQ